MFTNLKNIENFSDEELRTVSNQVLRLYETGITNEHPLRSMIDGFELGAARGISVVPQTIMIECTKRWCRKEN